MDGRLKNVFPLVLLGLVLTSCAGRGFEDRELLSRAQEAYAAASSMRVWRAGPERARAVITPESMALFPSMHGGMALLGTYGNYPDGSVRFALTMPQGTRVGSCLRASGGTAECQGLSQLAVVGNLVHASFSSLDEFFASAQDARPAAGESWRLQKGDAAGGVGRAETVLVRRRGLGWGDYVNCVHDLAGRPLVFYRVSGQELVWKLTFRDAGEKPSYTFTDNRYDWIINVEILEARFAAQSGSASGG